MGGGGGVGSVSRGGRKMGERESAPGATVGHADRGVGMAPGGMVGGGLANRGRCAGRGRRGAARLTCGAGR
jgi:hypothetical protein